MQKLLNYLKDYTNFYSCVVPVNFICMPLFIAFYYSLFKIDSFLELILLVPIPNILLLVVFYSFKIIQDKNLTVKHKFIDNKSIDYSQYSNVVPFKRRVQNESKVG